MPAGTRVDLGLVWRLPVPSVSAPLTRFVQGRNLTDEDIRVHTSFLKDIAPPPGRSFVVGLRAAI
jgi:iron complex outermembrane recepter protein